MEAGAWRAHYENRTTRLAKTKTARAATPVILTVHNFTRERLFVAPGNIHKKYTEMTCVSRLFMLYLHRKSSEMKELNEKPSSAAAPPDGGVGAL